MSIGAVRKADNWQSQRLYQIGETMGMVSHSAGPALDLPARYLADRLVEPLSGAMSHVPRQEKER